MSFFERAREFRGGSGSGSGVQRAAQGVVTRDGPRALRDGLGVFNPFSLTWFDLMHMVRNRPSEYETELSTVGNTGIFDCISWYGSLAPISYMDRYPDVRWSDYWQIAERCLVEPWERYKIRAQVVLMDENMDAPGLDNEGLWNAYVDTWGALYRKHPHTIAMMRICHEGPQTEAIRKLAQRLQAQCGALVAPDTPAGNEHSVALYGNAGFRIAGVQFDRSIDGTGKYREPFWKAWEGVIRTEEFEGEMPTTFWAIEDRGPYSSQSSVFDPGLLGLQQWLNFVLGACGTTLHDAVGMRHGGEWDRPPLFEQWRANEWGVYNTGQGIPARYQDTPHWAEIVTALRAVKAVLPPGIANWQRWNGHWRDGNGHPDAPLQIRHKDDTDKINVLFDSDKIFKAVCATDGSKVAYSALWVREPIQVLAVHRGVRLRRLKLTDMTESIGEPISIAAGETFTLDPSLGEDMAFQGEWA